MRGAGADIVVPGRDHHVLGAAPGIELVLLGLDDDDDDRGVGQPAGEATEPGDGASPLGVAHDDEAVGLTVLRAAGHTPGLKNSAQRLVGERLRKEGALVTLVHDRPVGVHRAPRVPRGRAS